MLVYDLAPWHLYNLYNLVYNLESARCCDPVLSAGGGNNKVDFFSGPKREAEGREPDIWTRTASRECVQREKN